MEELKELRLSIDGLFQLTDGIVKSSKSNDNIYLDKVNECSEKLLMAKAWTGKLMGYLGVPTPYSNDGSRKEVKDIEPTDAVNNIGFAVGDDFDNWSSKNHIEKIDFLRENIEKEVDKITKFQVPQGSSREANIARTQVFCYLTESKLMLGFELERVRGGR